jgi:ribosome-interacting GTPase 1
MPANLPPQYFEAEKAYRQARSVAEKIEALEMMLAVMPKHKGTDHLRAELRARIARLSEEGQRRAGGARAQLYAVRKEGAGQVALVGPPNVGKSRLLAVLTGAPARVADYPFTTQLPQPAMLPVENVQVQLVDLPAIVEHTTHAWMRPIVRQADLLLLVVDLSQDPLADLETTRRELAAMRVEPVARLPDGEAEDQLVVPRRALIAANKADAPGADDSFELLALEVADRWPLVAVSAATGRGLEELRRRIFAQLDVIRVYTRPPGRPPDLTKPFVLPRGSTIDDLAAAIHKDLAQQLRYAQVWGHGKFQGQRVGRSYVLEDGDVVELVT